MNWDRVYTARARAKGLFLVAGFAILIAVLLLVAGPSHDPWIGSNRVESFGVGDLPIWIGIGGVIFGLAWMWRLYKAPTKYEGARWRYRDRD
jgi:hypothetical protein